jgi:hypothetical protein
MTTIRYGLSNQVERTFSPSYTIRDLLTDRALLAQLNAPEGVVAVSLGDTLEDNQSVSQFSSITLEKRASSKA